MGSTEENTRRPQSGGAGAREQLLAGIPVTERRLLLAGVSTSVLEGGAGPPLVLLHGPGGYSAMWRQVMPDLTTTHRVVAPDLPGHGASDRRRRPAGRGSRDLLARRADRAHMPDHRPSLWDSWSAVPSPHASPPTTASGSTGSCSLSHSASRPSSRHLRSALP